MKKLLLTSGLFVSLIIGSNAQEETSTEKANENPHRYLSMGIEANLLRTSDFQLSDFMPVSRLHLAINPIKYVRVDFQFGMSSYQNNQTVTDWSGPNPVTLTFLLKDKYVETNFGLFGVYPFKDGFISYLGFRYGMGNYTYENLNNNGSGYFKEEDRTETKNTSIVIGMEYKFFNRFSVSGEFRFNNMKIDPITANPPYNLTDYAKVTETSIIFRFYPF